MFECNLCKYVTKITQNFNNHINSQSHIMLFEKNIRIQRKRKENKLKKDIEFKDSIQTMDKKLDKIDKQQLETDKKVNKINKSVKKITDYIDFLNTHCLDAEPLTSLTDKEIEELLKLKSYKKNKFEEMIIGYMKCDKIDEKLGQLILAKYLNHSDLTKQQIWASDISRLIYLIMQIINNEKNWVRDKKGEMFSKLIISPIVNKIQTIMGKYAENEIKKFDNDNIDNPENQLILERVQFAEEFTGKLYGNNVKKELLKFMSSKFSLCVKKDEIEDVINL